MAIRQNKQQPKQRQTPAKSNNARQSLFDEDDAPTPKDRARELAYDAMESYNPKEALRFARAALKLDPDNLDALRIEANFGPTRAAFVIDALKQVVRRGEELLGKEFFRQNHGHFWLVFETRPYMRALADLSQAYQHAGRYSEAIEILQRILHLNPNDNQGVRYPLVVMLLATQRLEEARQLLDKYHEHTAMMSWARVLERYASRDLGGAKRELKTARESNAYVESYLTGRKKLPAMEPDYYSPGAESEAEVCAIEFQDASRRYPEWLQWLRLQVI